MNEWNFFQIPHTGVQEPDLDGARTDTDVPIRRKVDMKICNFGALSIGLRRSDDYTKTELYFKDKDELADWTVINEDGGAGGRTGLRSMVVDVNPYIWGSTVKKTRDDQFFRMTMDNNQTGNGIDQPKFDVMDTNVVDASGMVSTKNYPTEGWRSFGGKYDFPVEYDGVFR